VYILQLIYMYLHGMFVSTLLNMVELSVDVVSLLPAQEIIMLIICVTFKLFAYSLTYISSLV
jgi:hypothetical protein